MIDARGCYLCGSEKSRKYYGYGAPGKRRVENRICENCGLVFLATPPSQNDLREYYAEYSAINQPEHSAVGPDFEELLLSIARQRLDFIKDHIKDGAKILDIGCGIGATLKVIRDDSGAKGLTLTGINPEERFSLFGEKKYGLNIFRGMFEDFDLAGGPFDFVILDNVLEHFADPCATLRHVHSALADGGRLFVATNNVHTPHGFLWQNFFPDHIVTFSEDTLKAALESAGYVITRKDIAGHMTYEGYHYPYQMVIAEKVAAPASYDFLANGDDAGEMIHAAERYSREWYSKDGLSKWAYELELGEPGAARLALRKAVIRAAKLIGGSGGYVMPNHTLPSEEHRFKRLIVVECPTEADVATARRQLNESALAGELIVFRNRLGGITLETRGDGVGKGGPFSHRLDMWRWLLSQRKGVSEAVVIRLRDADLPPGALMRAYAQFRKKGAPYMIADYRQFTNARIEFIRNDAFGMSGDRGDIGRNLIALSGDELLKAAIWPGKDDFSYYYETKFDERYGYPRTISLDLSPFCDKKCAKCQFHSPDSAYTKIINSGEMMPMELVKKVLEEAATWPVQPSLSPTFSGEALIYPHFREVVNYARERGIQVAFNTNGMAMDAEMSRFIIESQVSSVSVSLDAVNQETYSRLQYPGVLGAVEANIVEFLRIRGASKTPVIGAHFVMDEDNAGQFDEFLLKWGGRLDFVSRAIRQDQMGSCGCVSPMWGPPGKRQACWAAWTSMYIRWDGSVSFCGFDIDTKYSKQWPEFNAWKAPLLEMWRSEPFGKWRKAQLENDMKELYCKGCPDWAGMRQVKQKVNGYEVSKSAFTETYSRKG